MTDPTPKDLSNLVFEEFIALSPQGEHAPGPKPLSPAARAVERDISQIMHELHRWCRISVSATDTLPITLETDAAPLQAGINSLGAAAIRALADQIAPTKQDYEEASHGLATVFLNGVAYAVNEMRLIATELENAQ